MVIDKPAGLPIAWSPTSAATSANPDANSPATSNVEESTVARRCGSEFLCEAVATAASLLRERIESRPGGDPPGIPAIRSSPWFSRLRATTHTRPRTHPSGVEITDLRFAGKRPATCGAAAGGRAGFGRLPGPCG